MSSPKNQKIATAPVTTTKGNAPETDPLARWIPYVKPALIGVAIVLLLILGYGYWTGGISGRKATQWNEFNMAYYESLGSGSPDVLADVGVRFPDTMAGASANQMAGDMYAQLGLNDQLLNRELFEKNIRQAKEQYQKVIDSPLPKDSLVYQQAKYSLAYTTEMLGDAAMANEMYQEFLKNYPDSPFSLLAERGTERCNLAKASDFFAEFDAYNFDVVGAAPGAALPELPDIRLDAPEEAGPAEGAPDRAPKIDNSQPSAPPDDSDPAPAPPGVGDQPDSGQPSEEGSGG
jgi:hypothetical protein